jgi:hypothetical protein
MQTAFLICKIALRDDFFGMLRIHGSCIMMLILIPNERLANKQRRELQVTSLVWMNLHQLCKNALHENMSSLRYSFGSTTFSGHVSLARYRFYS